MPENPQANQNQADTSVGLDSIQKAVHRRFQTDNVLPRWMKVTPTSNGKTVNIKVFSDLEAASTGDGKFIFFIPSWWAELALLGAEAYVTGASSSGALTIQVRNVTDSVDMLSTAITIDQSELSSLTAATPVVINAGNATVAAGDQIAIDVDGAGTSAEGLGVVLLFG